MMRRVLHARLLLLVAFAMLAAVLPMAAQAGGPGLQSAAGFAVLADSTGLTCTDSTVVGPVGVKSGTPVTSTRCVMPLQGSRSSARPTLNIKVARIGPGVSAQTTGTPLTAVTLTSRFQPVIWRW